jgi:hypothetical protein
VGCGDTAHESTQLYISCRDAVGCYDAARDVAQHVQHNTTTVAIVTLAAVAVVQLVALTLSQACISVL